MSHEAKWEGKVRRKYGPFRLQHEEEGEEVEELKEEEGEAGEAGEEEEERRREKRWGEATYKQWNVRKNVVTCLHLANTPSLMAFFMNVRWNKAKNSTSTSSCSSPSSSLSSGDVSLQYGAYNLNQ